MDISVIIYSFNRMPVSYKEETTVLLHTIIWMNLTYKNEERGKAGPEVPTI